MKNEMIVVCDFDGTITKKDTINDFLDNFADKSWQDVEDDWIAGKISTCDAMELQFRTIKNITREKFESFFETVEIDDHFEKFYLFCKEREIKIVIISDGFEYFIRRILNKFSIDDIEIYSNYFEFNSGDFVIGFPHKSANCVRGAGTCKCAFIHKFRNFYKKIIYIGDGASDFCPASEADYLFAKNRLFDYCQTKNIPCIKYTDFEEVLKNDIFNY